MVEYGKGGDPIVTTDEIVAVYYLIDDYSILINMPNDEFEEVMKEAALIWEK